MTSQSISQLKLTNFRCFGEMNINLDPKINIITGNNGTGKTSIIDAIYCLAFGRSYFVSKESFLIKEGCDFSRLDGVFNLDDDLSQVVLKLQSGKSKVIEVNKKKRKSIVEHVGQIPIVCIAPSDIHLVRESAIIRRSLLDKLLSQIDTTYFSSLLAYNRLLKQRNAYLKGNINPQVEMLDVFDDQMSEPALYISHSRKEILMQLLELFHTIHDQIVSKAEQCDFKYKTQLSEDQNWSQGVKSSRQKDCITRRSNFGIHKDDIEFKIGGKELKYVGSQGQIKSFVFALKMAIFMILRNKTKKNPVVLLDDIFDKLDDERVMSILQFVESEMDSQILITDTSDTRLSDILQKLKFSYHKIALN